MSHVKFVSYNGKWPCLCLGDLTLEVNGKQYTWGYGHRLIMSGGSCSLNEIEKGEWIILEKEVPDEIKEYIPEIEKVVNDNIEFGCCGGCR